MFQLFTGLAVFVGEALTIGAEMWAARHFAGASNQILLVTEAFGVSVAGIAFLVFGYTWGYQAFANIWIITAISIAGIVIVEPIVAWILFQQLPTLGAVLGLALGLAALAATIFVK